MGRLFDSLLALLIVLFVTPILYLMAVNYESHVWPVVGNLTITRVEALPGDRSHIWVAFDRYRPECSFVGINWYVKMPNNVLDRREIVTRSASDQSATDRDEGKHIAGPWTLAMKADEVRDKSYVTLNHNCHPLFLTKTVWYDGGTPR